MVEEGDNVELECSVSGDWKLCEWKKQDDSVKCYTYKNSEGNEIDCENTDRAKIVAASDSCKVDLTKLFISTLNV